MFHVKHRDYCFLPLPRNPHPLRFTHIFLAWNTRARKCGRRRPSVRQLPRFSRRSAGCQEPRRSRASLTLPSRITWRGAFPRAARHHSYARRGTTPTRDAMPPPRVAKPLLSSIAIALPLAKLASPSVGRRSSRDVCLRGDDVRQHDLLAVDVAGHGDELSSCCPKRGGVAGGG